MTAHLLASIIAAKPAGGAAIGQIVIATSAAMVMTTALLWFGMGHRNGTVRHLGRAADFAGRVGGLPGWAALPAAVASPSLICALFGMYWDISLHIDNGRDPGPLANPAHYFILAGLFGIFAAGWIAIVLPKDKPGPAAIRIREGWYAPLGGVLMMACASFSLIGFPLDDVFHRLFGQDVTLWGPTHLMLLTGAAMTLIAILTLLVEARLAGADELVPAEPEPGTLAAKIAERLAFLTPERVRAIRLISACGGLLIGMSIYQGEFAFGVPQFRLLFQPVLLALAAGFALTVARSLGGPGAALGSVAFYAVVFGAIALIVGGVFGETVPHFAPYVVEALLVEGTALAIGTRRPYRFAVVAGALIGTVGIVAEYGWSHVWMPIPWPSHILGTAIAFSLPVAIGGALVGAFAAAALRLDAAFVTRPRVWMAPVAGLLAFAAITGYLLHTTVPAGVRADVTLADAAPAPHRTVQATVRVPERVTKDADWYDAISWQGHGKLVLERMQRVAPGVYRTTKPLPAYGEWKSVIRIHRDSVMASVPVYMPGDTAIPAREIPATPHFSRTLIADHTLLQRERKRDVPAWLFSTAALVVLAIAALLLAMLGWGLVRLARAGAGFDAPEPSPGARTAPVARTPLPV